jgi:hypothetical protein
MKQINEDRQYNGRSNFTILPDNRVDTLKNSTTPNVENRQVFKGCGSVVSVTQFKGGADGQTIRIKGDGTTTIVHGTYIKTNTGANKLLAVNRLYAFTYFNDDNVWIEH